MIITCPNCNGEGWFETTKRKPRGFKKPFSNDTFHKIIKCTKCDGTGEIVSPVYKCPNAKINKDEDWLCPGLGELL
jgi:DnaJ-class molecular chaperone